MLTLIPLPSTSPTALLLSLITVACFVVCDTLPLLIAQLCQIVNTKVLAQYPGDTTVFSIQESTCEDSRMSTAVAKIVGFLEEVELNEDSISFRVLVRVSSL